MQTGGTKRITPFEMQSAKSVDARYQATSITDMLTTTLKYEGMLIYVAYSATDNRTGKLYKLKPNSDGTQYAHWQDVTGNEASTAGESITYSQGTGIIISESNIISTDTDIIASKIYVDQQIEAQLELLEDQVGITDLKNHQGSNGISITNTNSTAGFVIKDTGVGGITLQTNGNITANQPISYTNDFSNDFTSNNLVSKKYVDDLVTSLGTDGTSTDFSGFASTSFVINENLLQKGIGSNSIQIKNKKYLGKVTLTNGASSVVGVGNESFLANTVTSLNYLQEFVVVDSAGIVYWVDIDSIINSTTAVLRGSQVLSNDDSYVIGSFSGITGTYDFYQYFYDVTATNAVILGGESKLIDSDYDQFTYVDRLAIENVENADGAGLNSLVYDPTSGKVKQAASSSVFTAGSVSSAIKSSTNQANANYSFAVGQSNISSGVASVAEGRQTISSGEASHSEGYNSSAGGYASHAEGASNFAAGNYSHVEGFSNKASGQASHAEGFSNTSTGNYSHTEGGGNSAIGNYSHAEGFANIATGTYAHVEGGASSAGGNYSHAEGYNTHSNGLGSHSEGYFTKATGNGAHAGGVGYNSQRVNATGAASFNHSSVDSEVTGAAADDSAILGGRNNSIATGNLKAVVLGGDGINLTGNSYVEHTVVENLAIWTAPATDNIGTLNALVYDPTTKKVMQRAITGGSSSGTSGVVSLDNYQSTNNANIKIINTQGTNTLLTISPTNFTVTSKDSTFNLDLNSTELATPSLTVDATSIILDSSTITSTEIKYADNYGSNFTSRSLVDKLYVDQEITDANMYLEGSFSGAVKIKPYKLPGVMTLTNGSATVTGVNTVFDYLASYSEYEPRLYVAHNQEMFVISSFSVSNATTLTIVNHFNTTDEDTPLGANWTGSTGAYECYLSLAMATDYFAVANGIGTIAKGAGSYAQGRQTIASGVGAHAEGYATKASSNYSHSEGYKTVASATSSHAQGNRTTASGVNADATGDYTIASGISSHTGGKGVATKEVKATGNVAFNHSENNSSATINKGAQANNSAILGGVNHNIDSANLRAVILGGNAIDLTGNGYIDTTVVQKLAIWETPATDSGSLNALVYDPVTKVIKQRAMGTGSSTAGGSGIQNLNSYSQTPAINITSGTNFTITGNHETKIYGKNGQSEVSIKGDELLIKHPTNIKMDGIVTLNEKAAYATSYASTSFNNNDLITKTYADNIVAQLASTSFVENIAEGLASTSFVEDRMIFEKKGTNSIQIIGRPNTTTVGTNNINLATGSTVGGFNNLVAGEANILDHHDSIMAGSGNRSTSGAQAYNAIFGYLNVIGAGHSLTAGAFNRNLGGDYSIMAGSGNTLTDDFSAAFGANNYAYGKYNFVMGNGATARGLNSINMSESTSGSNGIGASANHSVILGGRNNSIAVGNTKAVILGGDGINLTGSSYADFVAVQNLAIWNAPATDSGSLNVLVYDPATKKVMQRALNGTAGGTGGIDLSSYATKTYVDDSIQDAEYATEGYVDNVVSDLASVGYVDSLVQDLVLEGINYTGTNGVVVEGQSISLDLSNYVTEEQVSMKTETEDEYAYTSIYSDGVYNYSYNANTSQYSQISTNSDQVFVTSPNLNVLTSEGIDLTSYGTAGILLKSAESVKLEHYSGRHLTLDTSLDVYVSYVTVQTDGDITFDANGQMSFDTNIIDFSADSTINLEANNQITLVGKSSMLLSATNGAVEILSDSVYTEVKDDIAMFAIEDDSYDVYSGFSVQKWGVFIDSQDLTNDTQVIVAPDAVTFDTPTVIIQGDLEILGTVSGSAGLATTTYVQSAITTAQTAVQKTSGNISFSEYAVYGTEAAKLTGNFTFDFTDAKLGMTVFAIHNSGTEPTYPTSAKKSGTYTTSTDNIISFTYISNTMVLVSINKFS